MKYTTLNEVLESSMSAIRANKSHLIIGFSLFTALICSISQMII